MDWSVVVFVSDHGAKKLDGCVCVNEWLIEQGYLALQDYPAQPIPIHKLYIDWSGTRAWGDGGYYGRIFLNVRGREPQRIVEADSVGPLLEELRAGLETLTPGTCAYRPVELFREVNGCPPDLIVYFADLHWRSVGSVGMRSVYTFENDRGPDEANHDWHGIFISPWMNGQGGAQIEKDQIYDIGPTVLTRFGLAAPAEIMGQSLALRRLTTKALLSPAEGIEGR
ncbi:alkaline phosphatase family protein [Acidobacteriia bacterium AH_259_A11_L15]|nr:alkaline phosphatase family protein [Acidobacteriia bacterium AH_259_A11_L15]